MKELLGINDGNQGRGSLKIQSSAGIVVLLVIVLSSKIEVNPDLEPCRLMYVQMEAPVKEREKELVAT